jgi:hypothetical protein
MAEPLSVTMLRSKRDKIRDVIAAYERKLREAQADLAHVNATLRLFMTTGEPEDFTPYMDLTRVFRRGETTTICLAALAKEGPLDTRELTARVMGAKRLDTADRVLFQAVALRIVQTLRVRAMRGGIDGSARRKGVCLWRVVTSSSFAVPGAG